MNAGRVFNTLATAVLVAAALVVLGVAAWFAVLDEYAGGWRYDPEDAPWLLPDSALERIDAAFDGLDGAVVDHRIALLSDPPDARRTGPDDPQADIRVEPSMSPLAWMDRRFVRHAAGVRHAGMADAEYVARLLRQMQAMPGAYRGYLFARDAVYDAQGEPVPATTRAFVSNARVVALAAHDRDRLTPVVSVHPRRRDMRDALERWAEAGVRDVSWLPAAQRIDLDSEAARAAYDTMATQDMTLHVRVGRWPAAEGGQRTVDPAALAVALDTGVQVVVTLGTVDSDGVDVMARLFDLLRDDAYRAQLTVNLAGVLAGDRLETVLIPLLQHPQFFERLRYGSGYPEMAVVDAIDPGRLADHDFIDTALAAPLRAIYDVNPLLYAFVVMRHIRLPTTGLGFPDEAFTADAS